MKRISTFRIVLTAFLLLLLLCALFTLGAGVYLYRNPQLWRQGRSEERLTREVEREFSSQEVFTPNSPTVDLVQKVVPAVTTVTVRTAANGIFGEQGEVQAGVGTGFFISEDGLLITNEHVVCESTRAADVSIVTSDNRTYSVETIAADPTQDLAILKVNVGDRKVSTLTFANANSQLQVGQDVLAIGNPLGENPGSVTRGIVSGLNRNVQAAGSCRSSNLVKDYEAVIQTDAAINPGNSGGPLLNANGEVIAVNSATSGSANNISYAVPFDRVLRLLERYQRNNGSLTLPFIGVEYRMVDSNTAKANYVPVGALVRSLVGGGPAEGAGIRRGDIITKIGERQIDFSLQATLNHYFEPNQEVAIEVFRPTTNDLFGDEVGGEGRTLSLNIRIGQR